MDTSVQPVSSTPTPNAEQPSNPVVPQVSSPKSSPGAGLWVAIVIVLLVVVGVGAMAFMSKATPKAATTMAVMTPTVTMMMQITVAPSPASQSGGLSQGTSDANLSQDSKSLSNGLNSATTQMGTVDQGLNDQPADLSQ